jgi:hypothetical protein
MVGVDVFFGRVAGMRILMARVLRQKSSIHNASVTAVSACPTTANLHKRLSTWKTMRFNPDFAESHPSLYTQTLTPFGSEMSADHGGGVTPLGPPFIGKLPGLVICDETNGAWE